MSSPSSICSCKTYFAQLYNNVAVLPLCSAYCLHLQQIKIIQKQHFQLYSRHCFSCDSSAVIGFIAGKMVDRNDLIPAALSQDVLTVFQFYAYIIQHEVQDMETHLLHLAREGE